MDEDYREVRFDLYCKDCKHKEVTETESPCNECLEHPVNLHTYKPVNWKETDKNPKREVANNERNRSSNR